MEENLRSKPDQNNHTNKYNRVDIFLIILTYMVCCISYHLYSGPKKLFLIYGTNLKIKNSIIVNNIVNVDVGGCTVLHDVISKSYLIKFKIWSNTNSLRPRLYAVKAMKPELPFLCSQWSLENCILKFLRAFLFLQFPFSKTFACYTLHPITPFADLWNRQSRTICLWGWCRSCRVVRKYGLWGWCRSYEVGRKHVCINSW